MGRGRAKAKQAKVARELKYQTPDTDLEALQRELSSDPGDGDDRDHRYWDRDGTGDAGYDESGPSPAGPG